MFALIQLAMIILTTVFYTYSMDTQPNILCNKEWENSFAQYIINEQINAVPFRCADIKERVSAMRRIYATSEYGDVYLHDGIVHNCLQSSDGNRFAQIRGKFAIIFQKNKSKSWSMSGVEVGNDIRSTAFNADGSVLALVSDREIAVCDLSDKGTDEALNIRLKKFLNKREYAARHVALSDSGNKMAVGVVGLDGLRIVVIDTSTNQELYNLIGNSWYCNFRFFYMMGENIIAMCFNPQNMEYNLNIATKILKELTPTQKFFLNSLYKNYSATKRLLSLSSCQRNESYASLPDAVKPWAHQFVCLTD